MTTLPREEDDALFELGLRELREEEGSSEQARALEQRLLEALGPKALAAPAVASRRAFGAWATKPMKVLFGSVLLVGLSTYFARDADEDAPKAAPIAAPPPAMQAPAPVEPVRDVQAPTVEEAPQVAQPRPKPTTPRPTRVDELTLMQRARDALQGDPKATLKLAEQHARLYPAGVFVQEREVLAINALLRQERSSAAYQRAERFIATHGSSPYAVQLRAMLATAPRLANDEDATKGLEP
jgi:hypothetical protein